MADDFDPATRPRRRLWPVLLLLPIAAVLAWWFGWNTNENANPALAGVPVAAATDPDTLTVRDAGGVVAGVPAASVPGAPEEVNEFLAFAARHQGDTTSALPAATVAEGVQQLVAAARAAAGDLAGEGDPLGASGDSVLAVAGAISREPNAQRQAELARGAFTSAAAMLAALPARSGAAAAAENARLAAESIDPRTALDNQAGAVHRFFAAAASAVQAMAEAGR